MKIAKAIQLYEDSLGLSGLARNLSRGEMQHEAHLLLSHILGKSHSWLLANQESNFNTKIAISIHQQKQYLAYLARRANNEPLAYIIGEWGFYDNLFNVTPAVLIPRPESEVLIDWVLEKDLDSPAHKTLDVLEIGCGSGALAVTLSLKRPHWHITATDISMSALAVAQSNIVRHGCNIRTYKSDIFSRVTGKYDIIIANLPYISWSEMLGLNELREEPRLALTDGGDGLKFIRQLFAEAANYLKYNGTLLVEYGYQQGVKVNGLATIYGYVNPNVIYDLDNRKRGLAVQKPYRSRRHKESLYN